MVKFILTNILFKRQQDCVIFIFDSMNILWIQYFYEFNDILSIKPLDKGLFMKFYIFPLPPPLFLRPQKNSNFVLIVQFIVL